MGQRWETEPEFHIGRFAFYSESNGELLEDFKYGNRKSDLHLGKITNSSADYIERSEA